MLAYVFFLPAVYKLLLILQVIMRLQQLNEINGRSSRIYCKSLHAICAGKEKMCAGH